MRGILPGSMGAICRRRFCRGHRFRAKIVSAGNIGGIHANRSGLVWQWLRILDELGDDAPRVVCLENVVGLVSSRKGEDYRQLHSALVERGYRVGAVLLNADWFVPPI